MKKLILSIALVTMFSLSVSASAISPYYMCAPSLVFNGTTAECYITVITDSSDDQVSVVLKLSQGNNCIKTWESNFSGTSVVGGEKTVKKGLNYTLSADITINGKTHPTTSVSGTCR